MKLALALAAPLALLGCASAPPPSIEIAAPPAPSVEVSSQSPFHVQISPAEADAFYIYVLNATDPEKPHLAVYAFSKGRELELRAARTLEHDDFLSDFTAKGRSLSPETIRHHRERTEKD